MEPNRFNDFPWNPSQPPTPRKRESKISVGTFISVLCIVIVVTIMLTYTLTSALVRSAYTEELQRQDQVIDGYRQQLENLRELLQSTDGDTDSDFGKLKLLSMLFEQAGYYADQVSEEDRLEAVLKAYMEATGDDYAEYYTEEEYAALVSDNTGHYEGIGVSVIQTELTVEGYRYKVFQVISIYQNAPAAASGLQVGDYIFGIRSSDESYVTIDGLGGYTAALNAMRGESGTQVELAVFRQEGESYRTESFSITRSSFVTESVDYTVSEQDPTIGIVRIREFDMTTPKQLKEAVDRLLADGAERFVFDLRNNPGGDLRSIQAVLTYFLNAGDVILSAIDRDGNKVASYYAETLTLSGDYAACNVTADEIGMYRDLDMVVLCNENTASAAEVFTATMRDYGLATIVGETTYGKGIMQSIIPLSQYSYGVYDGYIKMTTYAYVTKCDVPYHQIGIVPDVEVELSKEARSYNIYTLPQSLDDQLIAAIAQFAR